MIGLFDLFERAGPVDEVQELRLFLDDGFAPLSMAECLAET